MGFMQNYRKLPPASTIAVFYTPGRVASEDVPVWYSGLMRLLTWQKIVTCNRLASLS